MMKRLAMINAVGGIVLGLLLVAGGIAYQLASTSFQGHAKAEEGVVTDTEYETRTPYAVVKVQGGRTYEVSDFASTSRPSLGARIHLLVASDGGSRAVEAGYHESHWRFLIFVAAGLVIIGISVLQIVTYEPIRQRITPSARSRASDTDLVRPASLRDTERTQNPGSGTPIDG